MRWYWYALKELINNRRFTVLFILNLAFGLCGFIALDGFKTSLEQTIRAKSKAVLGADFGISARRPIAEDESDLVESHLGKDFQVSEQVEMFSMVANKSRRSRLVQVKAIDGKYPFYGDIILENHGPVDEESHRRLLEEPVAWVYPELMRQLGIEKGDDLIVGETHFKVIDVVVDDSAAGLSTNMAPRIYIHRNFLKDTRLLRKGSIAWHSQNYFLPGRSNDDLSQLRDRVFKDLDSPEVRVFTHENVSSQTTALMSRLNDFLGLSSLVALFLASVGGVFLFRSYFKMRVKQVAILLSLGASRQSTFFYSLFQVLVLGFLSALLAGALSLIIVPGLGGLTEELLPFAIRFSIEPMTLVVGLLLGTVGCLFICLPILVSLKDLKPSLLLVDEPPGMNGFKLGTLLSLLPGVALFLFLSISLSRSYLVGGLFFALFLVSVLLLGTVGQLIFFALLRTWKPASLSVRWALRDLARRKVTTLSCFITIGLGSLLLNLVPQVRNSLNAELDRPEHSKLPSLFMFDIQDEQLDEFQTVLKKQNVLIDQISPMIRGRLMSVNGQEFDKGKGLTESFSREEEREMRFRNRGFNLSYREKLSDAESIVQGEDFKGPYVEDSGELPEVSVEEKFADRLSLKLGDHLVFDIESIPVEGRITNLRRVRWTSFRPNFFVQFQPGVLEMAPKTHVATVPHLDTASKHRLQDALVERLPNISLVDVSRIVKRIVEIMTQMSWALIFMSLLCLFAGFVVIYSIASHQAQTRKWEMGLLKSLGAPFTVIRGQLLWQFTLLSVFALSMGAFLSFAVSAILSYVIFDSLWVFDVALPLATVFVGTLITVVVTYLAIARSLQHSTRELFDQK